MQAQEPDLTRIIVRYATSRGYQRVLGFVLAFLRPKLLGPDDFGLWTLLRLAPTYTNFAHLGTRDALRYLTPYHKGRNEQQRVEAMEQTVFTFSFVTNLVIAVGLLTAAFVLTPGSKASWGLGAMAVVTLLAWLYEHLLVVLKGHEEFSLVTRSNYFYMTVVFLLTIPALLLFKFYGLLISVPLAYLITVIYMRRNDTIRLRFGFHRPLLRQLLRSGFPIMALAFLIGVINTLDRFLVSFLLGVEQTGYYGLAALVIGFLMDTPGAAREVMEPRLMKTKDGLDPVSMALRYIFDPLRNTAYLMPFLIGPVFLLMPSLVEFLLPRYQASVQVAQVLTIGAFFFALTHPLRAVLVARSWQVRAVPLALAAIVVNVAVSVALVEAGFGVTGVAAGTVVSFAALFLLFYGFLEAKLGLMKMMPKGFLWRLALPLLIMSGLLVVLERSIMDVEWLGAVQRLAGLVLYTLLMLGLFYWDKANRQSVRAPVAPQ